MTQEQATKIVAYLNAAFIRSALEPESVAVYVRDIMLLAEGDVGMEAAQLIARSSDKFPTIREFRLAYRGVAERWRPNGIAPAEDEAEMPEWVKVWWWARNTKNERRVYSQMFFDRMSAQERTELLHHATSAGEITEEQYLALRDEWLKAGAPAPMTVKQLIL